MNEIDGYVTFQDVQDTIIKYHNTMDENISFRDAIISLRDGHSYQTGIARIPDFSLWDESHFQDLRALANEIPIYFSEILNIHPQYQNEDNAYHLPAQVPVQICFESSYVPDNFIILDYFILIYVLQGSCTLYTKNTKHVLNYGELAIISPNLPHRIYCEPDNLVINIMSVKEHFEDSFFQLLKKDNLLSAFFRKSIYQSKRDYLLFQVPPSEEINSILKHLFMEYVSSKTYAPEVFNNYLQIFYAQIIRSLDNTYSYYKSAKETSPSTTIPAILHYMNTHYHELSLQNLANIFHYDLAYLSKLIKFSTGRTYVDIITELKINEAKNLLLITDNRIDKISELVGYNSSDHFTHTFKKRTGISPKDYRKENKKQ